MNSTTNDPMGAMQVAEPILMALIGKRHREVRRDERQDLAQAVRLKLWESIIPKFDASRGAALSTYLYSSIRNAISDEIRRMKRVRQLGYEMLDDDDMVAPDSCGADSLIGDIIRRPDSYLAGAQAALVRLLQTVNSRSDLAGKLQVTQNTLDKRLSRLYADILALV